MRPVDTASNRLKNVNSNGIDLALQLCCCLAKKPTSKHQAGSDKLDAIEAEMKKIGYWSANPPDLQAEIKVGRLRSYLDALSFELWLQCVFLPNAREAV